MSTIAKGADWEIYADGVRIGTLTNMDIPVKTEQEREAERKSGLAKLRRAIRYAMRNPS